MCFYLLNTMSNMRCLFSSYCLYTINEPAAAITTILSRWHTVTISEESFN